MTSNCWCHARLYIQPLCIQSVLWVCIPAEKKYINIRKKKKSMQEVQLFLHKICYEEYLCTCLISDVGRDVIFKQLAKHVRSMLRKTLLLPSFPFCVHNYLCRMVLEGERINVFFLSPFPVTEGGKNAI